ncbi:hypothetical protein Q7P37_001525 [Cladosporium fusiforme]
MQDLAAIIIAIVSLVGTLVTVGVTSWIGYLSNEHRRKQELRKVFAKYQDALLLAAQDLQSRLYNIVDYNITYCYLKNEREQKIYFSTRLSQSDSRSRNGPTSAIFDIAYEFSTDKYSSDSRTSLMLWRGDQMAIGEIMTISEGGDLSPVGYGAFHKKWAEGRSSMNYEVEADGSLHIVQGGRVNTPGADKPHASNAQADNSPPDSAQSDEAQSGNLGVDNLEAPCQGRDPLKEIFSPSQRVFRHAQGMTEFRDWFKPIVEGVVEIAEAQKAVRELGGVDFSGVPDQRVHDEG